MHLRRGTLARVAATPEFLRPAFFPLGGPSVHPYGSQCDLFPQGLFDPIGEWFRYAPGVPDSMQRLGCADYLDDLRLQCPAPAVGLCDCHGDHVGWGERSVRSASNIGSRATSERVSSF